MVYKSGQIFLPFCYNSRVWRSDGQTEFSSLDRVCIPCSAVKTRSATTAKKLRVTNVWVTTRGTLALRTRPKAKLGVGCGRGSETPSRSPPPAVRVSGYYPRKICENSDAKSCILVTTCCEIFCFLKTTAKKLGGPIQCWSPNLKVGGTSLPGPYGCCAYE